jgi:glycosyltransferase involved in cell wall biosynthesis
MKPTISVIIPAYNAARTVGAAVDSVLAQSFADFELLVIDDGSRDDTAEVVGGREDPRVTCITTDNGGVATARNRGLQRAAGSYVAFLDADDAWAPRKLERQHLAMSERPDVGLVFTSAQLVDHELAPIGEDLAADRPDYTAALLLEGNVVPGGGSSVMARTALIERAGPFDSRLSQCADWDMWLRMSLITSFVAVQEPLTLYRVVSGTMSSDPALLERDTFALLDKFYAQGASAPYERVRRRAYANQSMVCAGTYLHAGRLRSALRCVVAGLRNDPRTVSRLVSLPARWVDRARRRLQGRAPRDPKTLRRSA